jgi:LppX_LprAFG lipoprotein
MLLMRLQLAFAFVLLFIVAACSGDNDSDAPAAATPNAARLLEESATATRNVRSFHFRLTHRNGTTSLPLDFDLDLETAEGDVSIPGRLKGNLRAKASGVLGVSVDVIAIDNQTWITNPFTRNWQRLSGASLRDFADPAALVNSLLPAVKDAKIVAENEVDGVRTRQIEGRVDSGELEDALGVAEAGNDVKVEVWIGVDDSLPRRLRITGPLSEDDDDDIERQVELSRFGEPVNITPPQ